MNYRTMIALFFIACLVAVDVVVAYTVGRKHPIENLATLLIYEGITILLLGAMATFSARCLTAL